MEEEPPPEELYRTDEPDVAAAATAESAPDAYTCTDDGDHGCDHSIVTEQQESVVSSPPPSCVTTTTETTAGNPDIATAVAAADPTNPVLYGVGDEVGGLPTVLSQVGTAVPQSLSQPTAFQPQPVDQPRFMPGAVHGVHGTDDAYTSTPMDGHAMRHAASSVATGRSKEASGFDEMLRRQYGARAQQQQGDPRLADMIRAEMKKLGRFPMWHTDLQSREPSVAQWSRPDDRDASTSNPHWSHPFSQQPAAAPTAGMSPDEAVAADPEICIMSGPYYANQEQVDQTWTVLCNSLAFEACVHGLWSMVCPNPLDVLMHEGDVPSRPTDWFMDEVVNYAWVGALRDIMRSLIAVGYAVVTYSPAPEYKGMLMPHVLRPTEYTLWWARDQHCATYYCATSRTGAAPGLRSHDRRQGGGGGGPATATRYGNPTAFEWIDKSGRSHLETRPYESATSGAGGSGSLAEDTLAHAAGRDYLTPAEWLASRVRTATFDHYDVYVETRPTDEGKIMSSGSRTLPSILALDQIHSNILQIINRHANQLVVIQTPTVDLKDLLGKEGSTSETGVPQQAAIVPGRTAALAAEAAAQRLRGTAVIRSQDVQAHTAKMMLANEAHRSTMVQSQVRESLRTASDTAVFAPVHLIDPNTGIAVATRPWQSWEQSCLVLPPGCTASTLQLPDMPRDIEKQIHSLISLICADIGCPADVLLGAILASRVATAVSTHDVMQAHVKAWRRTLSRCAMSIYWAALGQFTISRIQSRVMSMASSSSTTASATQRGRAKKKKKESAKTKGTRGRTKDERKSRRSHRHSKPRGGNAAAAASAESGLVSDDGGAAEEQADAQQGQPRVGNDDARVDPDATTPSSPDGPYADLVAKAVAELRVTIRFTQQPLDADTARDLYAHHLLKWQALRCAILETHHLDDDDVPKTPPPEDDDDDDGYQSTASTASSGSSGSDAEDSDDSSVPLARKARKLAARGKRIVSAQKRDRPAATDDDDDDDDDNGKDQRHDTKRPRRSAQLIARKQPQVTDKRTQRRSRRGRRHT